MVRKFLQRIADNIITNLNSSIETGDENAFKNFLEFGLKLDEIAIFVFDINLD